MQDTTVRRLQVWRTVAGAAAWVWLMITYRLVTDVGAVAGERFNQLWYSVLVLSGTLPVTVGLFIAFSRTRRRKLVYLRRALKPLGAVGAMIGSVFTFVIAAAPEFAGFRDLIGIPGAVLGVVVLFWMLGFAVYGMVLSLVHVFRTADIHDVLPPLLATALVWEMAVVDLATGAYDRVPFLARIAFVLGAPVSVTALALWELHRLRRRHGTTVREALGR